MLYYKTFEKNANSEWIVLIHGAGGSSSIWFKQLREYRKYFNILLLDLRGHGKSKNEKLSSRKYSFQEVSKDVIEVMDHLDLKSAHFIGISLGTIVIRVIADMEPQRVKSMILGGAVTRLTFKPQFLMKIGNLVKNFVPYMWLYRLFAWVIMPRKQHKNSRFLFINEAKKLYKKEFLRWYSLTANVSAVLKLYMEKDSEIPMLYIMGSEDYMFLSPIEASIKKQKHSTLHIIQDSGHVCNVDKPEEFNDVSINFIKDILKKDLATTS